MALLFVFNVVLAAEMTRDSSRLTLERIFGSREFQSEQFGPACWLSFAEGYTTLEPSESIKGARDIVHHDPETGARHIYIPAEQLIPAGTGEPLTIDDYEWSSDGKKLIIYTNSRRVWRRNTKGDYWVLNLRTLSLHKLGGNTASSSLMFAKFSPEGDRVAYVRDKNIYLENLKDNSIVPLTQDGGGTVINGTSDWVYEEEFELRDGFRWSPDGRKIAFWQFDTEGVRLFHLINNTDGLYPEITSIPYPKAGEKNSACFLCVVDIDTGKIKRMDIPGDPREYYIPRMVWTVDSKEIYFQHLNRLQKKNTLMRGEAESGVVSGVFTDKDEAWVEVVDDFFWLNKGRQFSWISERDGWRHLYLVSRDGSRLLCVTPFKFDVIDVVKIDEKRGNVYFLASPENPACCFLYRSRLSGKGQPEKLTPTERGMHVYRISPNGRWAFHTTSTFESPPETGIVELPEHKKVRMLSADKNLQERVKKLKRKNVEFFRVDIGKNIVLDGWKMMPPDFDEQKKYPVLFYVYGEPAGQTVVDRWAGSRYLWHLFLTQKGYIVISVDNRGTPAPRGRAWRKCIYRQVGIIASAEQAAAVRALLAQWKYLDSHRVGIWGWSGGGSMSLNAIFRYPELYRTAVSVAPVSNQRFYDTIYQERYMGLPRDNPEGYKNGSPINFAHKLEGNLLLIHGTGDDNVHYQSSEALVNELIRHNKMFSFMAYPNRSHSIREGENTQLHLFRLITRYIEEYLASGPESK
ncbi:MAG: S9 family peptidase [Candidatus Aminicenantes bacterium]|nr:S9 family peptidase [Candidatus Aminicenantes bacterium]